MPIRHISELLGNEEFRAFNLRSNSFIHLNTILLWYNSNCDMESEEIKDYYNDLVLNVVVRLRKRYYPTMVKYSPDHFKFVKLLPMSYNQFSEMLCQEPYNEWLSKGLEGSKQNANKIIKLITQNVPHDVVLSGDLIARLVAKVRHKYSMYGISVRYMDGGIRSVGPSHTRVDSNPRNYGGSTRGYQTIVRNPTFDFSDNSEDVGRERFEKLLKKYRKTKFEEKYGVELEFEPFGTIKMAKVASLDKRIYEVVEDGSLSPSGFEVISKPLNSIGELEGFTHEILDKILGMTKLHGSGTPAIHYHVSNQENPIGLFLLAEYFAPIFEDIRLGKKNELKHHLLTRPPKRALEQDENVEFNHTDYNWFKSNMDKGFDPYIGKKNIHVGRRFQSRGRRSTLRATGVAFSGDHQESPKKNTLEFRIFPQTNNHKLYHLYLKIVNGLLTHSKEVDWEQIYVETTKKGNPVFNRYKEFMDICDLSKADFAQLISP